MASQEYSFVEQDHNVLTDGDELPTYDDLAAQSGPNSRSVRLQPTTTEILTVYRLQVWKMERVD